MGFINRTSWQPQARPLIATARKDWNDRQLVPWTGPDPVWVNLAINNLDGTGHPFHLHGFDFYVLAQFRGGGGWDYFNPFADDPPVGGPLNTRNPLQKDTVFVPPFGYAVVRFRADNVGIWALHCHLLWHAGSGMALAIQVMGSEAAMPVEAGARGTDDYFVK
jgi:FtsP/CotA-like multicopper oxidase with cupredoxin domain